MEGWKRVKLVSIAEFINGYSFKPSDWKEEGMPIVRIEQLKNSDADFDYCDGNIPERNIINDGDLIFSWSASLFLKIWEGGKAALNQHLFKVLPKEGIDKGFLKYLIEYSIEEFLKSAHGSTMIHITRKELNKFEVNIPEDTDEQKIIAEFLYFIDQSIQQTESLISKYLRIKTGLMQDLLTKGIDEQGNIRSEQTHEFKDSPLGRIPLEWEVEPLKNYISYISYGFTNPMPEAIEGPYLVTAANVNHGRILYESCRRTTQQAFDTLLTNKSRPRINDVLITKDGSLGRMAIVDRENVCINQSVAVIRTNDKVDVRFFKMLLESPGYQARIMEDAGGSTIKHIYITIIDKMLLTMPSTKEEQQRIIGVLKTYEDNLAIEKDKLSKLHRIKTGLMQDLLTGRVRVTGLMKETNPSQYEYTIT